MKLPLCMRIQPLLILLIACAGPIQSAVAQSSPAAPAEKKDDDLIVLDVFDVSTKKDVGYVAENSLAGGRTNMALKDTAAAVSVMTREFMNDIGETNFQKFADWGVNSVPTYSGSLAFNAFDNGIQMRGPNVSFPSRNYFVWYINSDSYATERYEYARGPNGVLFGDGNPGGIVTIFTKQPILAREKYVAQYMANSYGGYSARVDLNQPVTKNLAFRLNLLSKDEDGWRDRTYFKNKGAHLGGLYKLTDGTVIRAEGEFGDGKYPITMLTYQDQASWWDKTTSYSGTALPSNPGYGRVSTSAYNVYVPAVPQAGVANWANQYKTNGTTFMIADTQWTGAANLPLLPSREYNLQPGDSWQRLEFINYNAFVEHRFSDNLFGQVAYSHLWNETTTRNSNGFNTYIIDINQFLPTATGGTSAVANPKFGKAYSDNQVSRNKSSNIVDDVRAFLAYRVENKWFKENLNAIVGSRLDRFDTRAETLYRADGPANVSAVAAANQLRVRYYWDEPGSYNMQNDFSGTGVPTRYITTSSINQRKTIDYAQIASATQLLNDTLTVFVGVRRDGFRQSQLSGRNDPTTGEWAPGNTLYVPWATNPTFVAGAKTKLKYNPVSKNAGAVYFALPWLGVYGNYSETFGTPNAGANLVDGSSPVVSVSKGKDFGFKFILPEGKLSARLGYYDTLQNNLLVDQLDKTQTDRIWTNMGKAELANIQWRDTKSLKLSGYEFEAIANPTRSIRLVFNYALPRSKNGDMYPGFKNYIAQNLAAWQAAANDTTNPNAAQIGTDINQIASDIRNQVEGVTSDGTYKYLSNVYGTYTFRSGAVKNLAFGLGANFRGPAKVGSTVVSAYDYLYSNSYYILSGHIGYERKFGKINGKIQLNVANILDNDDLIVTGYADYKAGGTGTAPFPRVPSKFRYIDPRKFTLTTTIEF
ncbi:MAG: TonB-dependent receptor [Nibricoccus sp.]